MRYHNVNPETIRWCFIGGGPSLPPAPPPPPTRDDPAIAAAKKKTRLAGLQRQGRRKSIFFGQEAGAQLGGRVNRPQAGGDGAPSAGNLGG